MRQAPGSITCALRSDLKKAAGIDQAIRPPADLLFTSTEDPRSCIWRSLAEAGVSRVGMRPSRTQAHIIARPLRVSATMAIEETVALAVEAAGDEAIAGPELMEWIGARTIIP